ncbi:hypothetical protein [Mobiluncus mulieris]|uniref:hypothetical protein n=1 Tax=Mobiluncus mulieris TaxID=2052 RepID=UPI0014705D75|nr:hypothetical protein [Mobiluncus mulieris]NMW90362.1 hypothetical protein [Mobiluncus mulieris]
MIEIAMPGELSRRAEPPGISRRGYHAGDITPGISRRGYHAGDITPGISRGDITGTVNRSPKQHPAVHRIIVHR